VKYESKIYGKVDWPWWHDALILGGALAVLGVVFRVVS
jgi:hypothetical protein